MEVYMNSMIRFCLVVFLFASVSIFAQTDMSNLRQTFQQMEDKWNNAMVAGDLNTLVDFYADDAVSLPSYMPMMRGKDEIRAGNKKDLESGVKYLSLTSTTTDVYGQGDLAYEIGTFDISLIPPNMTEQVKDHGKYLTIWQKQSDGTWKIKCDTFNSDNNPMSQTQAGAKEKDMYPKKDDNDK